MNSYNGFHLVEVPIPVPLKVVNCYLVQSSRGWHIIDTGFHTEDAKEAWKHAFRELHIAPQDIVEIVLTHFHPDHIGLAGWLQEFTKAPVRISSESKRMIQYLWIDQQESQIFDGFARQHGMDTQAQQKIQDYLHDFPKYVTPFPEFTTFEEGECFDWAGEQYVAIETPGHANGHMIFYSSTTNIVLAGDLLLPRITPNISYFPGFHPNPLQAFFDSLAKLSSYRLDTVLSGHRHMYKDGNKRAAELIAHHEERLQAVLTFVDAPSSAQEVRAKLFPRLPMDADPLQLLFALEETLAHLIYLQEKGSISCETGNDGVDRFLLKSAITA